MAHVLLPCDLPSWPDVLKLLQRLGECQNGHQMTVFMTSILEVCCVSLDPDNQAINPADISALGRFVDVALNGRERARFLADTLPAIARWAARLPTVRPARGLLYSIRGEDGDVELDRPFVSSLLANAFFSTFPKRNTKTHPTLQDFRMEHFFEHLDKRGHQKKLRAFLRYFESLDSSAEGKIRISRKALPGPSLPAWLCSDRPLVPLLLRPEGNLSQAETPLYRAYPCSSRLGGDIFTSSTSKESRLFFAFPELLVAMSFVEGLTDEEALIAEGTIGELSPAGFCLTDCPEDSGPHFEDSFLLKELNKTLAAFSHRSYARTTSSFLEEEEEEEPSSRRSSNKSPSPEDLPPMELRRIVSRKEDLQRRRSSQASSKLSLRTASQGSPGKGEDYFTADEDSEGDPPSDHQDGASTAETNLSHRSSSAGFVLGENSSHERLEDFRRRIRKRNRRRKSSRRRSGSGGSSSSDIEDISEEEEEPPPPPHVTMRPAHSEPSLMRLMNDVTGCPTAPLVHDRGRLVSTSNDGRLKAYSYDGVSPNLPVPFRARFRRRRSELDPSLDDRRTASLEVSRRVAVAAELESWSGDSGDPQLRAALLWLAASMAELQALVLYTAHAREISHVQRSAESRDWTVGDLSCEVLRFCRNRLRDATSGQLFGQILGTSS